jgi:hypothetical protein
VIGQYFGFGYPMPPSEDYLKTVILYYDKVAIPDFEFYATQYANFFNKRALDDWLEDLYTKYYRFERWAEAGLVEFTDSKSTLDDKSPFIKAHVLDCKDQEYNSTLNDLYRKHKMIFHVEFLARLDERLLTSNLKKALKENRGKLNVGNVAAWFKNQATIDSLNYALLEAWKTNKIPTTDSPIAEALLKYKLQRAVKKSQDPAQTLSTILRLTVPHFGKLPLEQILKIREDYGDTLQKFRKEVDRINELVNQQTDQEEKIQTLVQTEIYPQLVEIRKIQLDLQPRIRPEKMLLKGLLGRIPYIDLLLDPLEAINTYRKQREMKKHGFYLLSLL